MLATTSPPLPEKGDTAVAIEPTAIAENKRPGYIMYWAKTQIPFFVSKPALVFLKKIT